jgi:hypothetical protein
MICANGTFNAYTDIETAASLIIGSDFNIQNNITFGSVYVLGNTVIDGGKVLTSAAGGITIEKDLTIRGNGIEGGYIVSDTELIVNGNIYIDGNSVEKIKNATLPPVITLGNKRLEQLGGIYETLSKASGFSKLNINLYENNVLAEKIIIPEGADIVIKSKIDYARGLTIAPGGELVIAGENTKVLFDTNVSVSGSLNAGQGGAAELGKNRELEIIGKGALVLADNLLHPENKTVLSGAVMSSGGIRGSLVFDGGGINLFYSGENAYGKMELKDGGGISITGQGGVNIYGGSAAAENNTRLYGAGAVFGAASSGGNILLKATGEGGIIEIPAAAGSGSVFTVGGAGIIGLGADHTAKDGIALGGAEGGGMTKGTLRLLNGAYIGSASIPLLTAGGGSITQIGTLSPVEETDFSPAGTFAQTSYGGGGVDIQNIMLPAIWYGTISAGIKTGQ